MNCIVTAGPTFEPLDQVRRLTNFSTARLGVELGNHLAEAGHAVTLLLGELATWRGEIRTQVIERFTTTASLQGKLEALLTRPVEAVFHAAAVNDFAFGKAWRGTPGSELVEVRAGKLDTRDSPLLVELVPTPKILARLRGWFPRALLVGWKFEVEGGREAVLDKARRQMGECHTDACVANGPAYGPGFGLITAERSCQHLATSQDLYAALEAGLRTWKASQDG